MHTYAANIHGTKSGIVADKQAYEKYPSIKKFRADSDYNRWMFFLLTWSF